MNAHEERLCTGCDTVKTLREFPTHRSRPGGIRSRCKVCYAKVQREWRASHSVTQRSNPPTTEDKVCRVCGIKKPATEFTPVKRNKDGRASECKNCYPSAFPSTRRRKLKVFRLSVEKYDQMLLSQEGKCAICGNPEKKPVKWGGKARLLAVDHCHETGEVRGLLCNSCNLGLGSFRDDPERLQKAIDYLRNASC